MSRQIAIAMLAVWTALALPVRAQDSFTDALYADLLAKEQAVRAAFEGSGARDAALKALRTVVSEVEGLVRRFPSSGYCDDALWHAAQLSADAARRYDDSPSRTSAVRLFRQLASQYPTSRLARRVPAALSAVEPAGAMASAPERPATAPERVATIRSIRRVTMPGLTRVTIELDGEVPFRDERIANPERLFVDLRGTRAATSLADKTLRFDGDAALVRQIRVGRHPRATTRVVLEANGVSDYSIYPLYSPYRLVIDCIAKGGPAAVSLPPPKLPSKPVRPVVIASHPTGAGWLATPDDHARVAAAMVTAARVVPPEVAIPEAGTAPVSPAAKTIPPSRNVGGGFSISRQLGLGIARIVIDPGHGGHDPGAIGKDVNEAELVLDVALRLEKLLLESPGVEVVLTRRNDAYVPLQDRTAIANRHEADLFLSIHANASRNTQAQGVETYFLNFATTAAAKTVAARENAASGLPMGELPDLVKTIALNDKRDESRDLATFVQRALVERLRGANKTVKDLGVKEAPFIVLLGASMPSVLAEISFVTHAQEARLLQEAAYRQRIAEGLFSAINKYRSSLSPANDVARQR